ncbi:cation:dicarboxylate symporter family transporter [Xylanimonas ulmi]|uniref:Na+/H+-dicarboxylate symporter n=1 Tax=Xylanimonas ulmi TaxID=228973 RepID=A0A4Q7M3E6_9MICO|nr:cation:dicarboxylase symporter family transporter [Xylanibacterium ulmi]RZS61152.1 Na+/H+-dicarboxylate symporter [Xylanibacterium ulmi]
MTQLVKTLPLRLLAAIALGAVVGLLANETAISVVQSVRHLTGQLVLFAVPLIVLGFVAPSIARMGAGASRLLGVSLTLGYTSAVLASLLAAAAGYLIVPALSIPAEVEGLRPLPDMLFELDVPPVMPTMSALALALLLGLAVAWTRAERWGGALEELHAIVLRVVAKVVIPVLPLFIASVFALLAYQGRLTRQAPVFLQALGAVVAVHLVWVTVLYIAATAYSRRNPFEVVRHYGAAYLTAIGTMSSAATLGVALKGASASSVLDRRMVDFGVPLFTHVHMPGSVMSITFLALTTSQVLYGELPGLRTILLFVVLLGVFAVAAPGVPGGTLMASLGLVTSVLGFDEAGVGLMLAIFALQDSFGTSTNIVSDGPMLMVLSRYAQRGRADDADDAAPTRELVGAGAGGA